MVIFVSAEQFIVDIKFWSVKKSWVEINVWFTKSNSDKYLNVSLPGHDTEVLKWSLTAEWKSK